MISGNKNEYMWAKLDQDILWESDDVKLLCVTIENNLRFDKYYSMFDKHIFVWKQTDN